MYLPPFAEYSIRAAQRITRFHPKHRAGRKEEKMSLSDLEAAVDHLPIYKGDSLMVHSSLGCIDAKAEEVIAVFRSRIGNQGTLLMPTHPALAMEDDVLVYDIRESKSRVGYLTEFFRKMPGSLRSQHPFASVAAQGPKAEDYLRGNLQENSLPHGIHSAYYRFCKDGGKVLCIGVTAIGRATVKHVAEEVLDDAFLVRNAFVPRKVRIQTQGALIGEYVVRERTDALIAFLAKSRLNRDWDREKLVRKTKVQTYPVELLDAKACFEWMHSKAQQDYTMYPLARFSQTFR
jgi:aminoglycoside N3'-acetyltransferase